MVGDANCPLGGDIYLWILINLLLRGYLFQSTNDEAKIHKNEMTFPRARVLRFRPGQKSEFFPASFFTIAEQISVSTR